MFVVSSIGRPTRSSLQLRRIPIDSVGLSHWLIVLVVAELYGDFGSVGGAKVLNKSFALAAIWTPDRSTGSLAVRRTNH